MKNTFSRNLYWLLPIIILVVALSLLFRDSYLQMNEVPSKGWSNGLFSETTDINQVSSIKQDNHQSIIIPRIDDDNLFIDYYDDNFSLLTEDVYPVHTDKNMSFHIKNNSLIYFSKHTIYDEENNIVAKNVDSFHPQERTIFYTKDDTLFELNPKDNQIIELMKLNKKDFSIADNGSKQYILTYASEGEFQLELSSIENGNHSSLSTMKVPMRPGRQIYAFSFAIEDEKIALALQTKEKQKLGTADISSHFIETNWSQASINELTDITVPDPESESSLQEIEHISPRFIDGTAHFLFQAMGYTETLVRDDKGFNIYEGSLLNETQIKTERKSNTPSLSSKPVWIHDNAIAWLEPGKDTNDIYISSNDKSVIKKANKFNQDYFSHALGKTLMKMVTSLLMIYLSIIWVIWPAIFIIFMYVFRVRTIDRQPPWILYTGISIYLIGALIFKDVLFRNSMTLTTPSYLTFTGSPYVYITLFALISFISVKLVAKYKEWGISSKLTYFIAIHILLMIVFFGPYLI